MTLSTYGHVILYRYQLLKLYRHVPEGACRCGGRHITEDERYFWHCSHSLSIMMEIVWVGMMRNVSLTGNSLFTT